MDEKKLEEQLKSMWDENPPLHSNEEKEICWKEFQSKAFPLKKQKSKAWRYYASAAAVLIFVLVGNRMYFNQNPLNTEVKVTENTIINSTSAIKFIALPDSSRVELSPKSKIVYANNFASNRRVEVTGEAYFKVKKDKKHPFQVFCNETTTTVLGTSFTVKGFNKKEVTVALYEGSVQMNVAKQKEKWILKPGEKFTYTNKIALVAEFDRFMDFDNEKLSVVSAYIESNYGYKVTIPQQYDNQKITVRINKKEDLKTIIQLIAEMYNLNYEVNEKLKHVTFQ